MHRPMNQTEQNVRNLDTNAVDAFLELDADGIVTVHSGKVELGTGTATALSQIVAGELGVPLESIRVVMGDTALTPDQGTTAGSKTIQVAGPVLRRAGASAREALLERAAERLELPVGDLRIEEGMVRSASEPSLAIPIGDLAGPPFDREIASEASLMESSSNAIVGQPARRVDLLAKLTGADAFVQDVRLEGMLHGRVVRPHVRTMDGIGATIEHVDDREARAIPGVVEIVRNGSFIGVVAEREEQAVRSVEALRMTWSEPDPLPDRDAWLRRMREIPAEDAMTGAGDVDAGLRDADRTLTATYTFPYQAHASMGPSCAVADVRGDDATIYTSTQGVYGLRAALAPLLGMDEERIRLVFREGAGCYGHNGADDVTADAALLSQAVGRPVRLQWMRQDEFAWEPKTPAMIVEMRAGLDESGGIVAWDHAVWTPTHVARPNGQPGNLLAGQQVDPPMPPAKIRFGGGDRNAPTTYTFPNERVTMHWLTEAPLRPSALRSLGGLNNTTANEIFLDEIAAATGADPVEMRLRYQADTRAVEVIKTAAERAGWGSPLAAADDGKLAGRGFAFVRYETEYACVATVAEVELDPASGEVRVTRVVVAHDCGLIINPDGVVNQVEGNVIQGVSRALMEEVTWGDRAVTSLTWETYPILTFPDVPEIEVVLIDRPEEPSFGAGEPAICTVTAAIGNAIFDATGARLRDVPFTPVRVLAALGEH